MADKDIGLCFSCIEGFYLDRKDGKCKSNKDYNEFLYCKEAEDVCISCQKNYFLGEDNLCSSSKNCSESKDGLCLSCEENYYLGLDHKCTIIWKLYIFKLLLWMHRMPRWILFW